MEIVIKYQAGNLRLPEAPHLWIPTRREFFQIEPLALTELVIYRSGRLSNGHKDPFDRLIAAHGIESGSVIISPDSPPLRPRGFENLVNFLWEHCFNLA